MYVSKVFPFRPQVVQRAGKKHLEKGFKEFTCQSMAVTVLCVPYSLDTGLETLATFSFPPGHATTDEGRAGTALGIVPP